MPSQGGVCVESAQDAVRRDCWDERRDSSMETLPEDDKIPRALIFVDLLLVPKEPKKWS
jgi:hypothetical protein